MARGNASAELRKLAAALQLAKIATARRASDALRIEIESQFDRATDPYGEPWDDHAPSTVSRWGAHPLLQLTGRGRASLKLTASNRTQVITGRIKSMGLDLSNKGTINQPQRRVFPQGREPLPKAWHDAIAAAIGKSIRVELRGSR